MTTGIDKELITFLKKCDQFISRGILQVKSVYCKLCINAEKLHIQNTLLTIIVKIGPRFCGRPEDQ